MIRAVTAAAAAAYLETLNPEQRRAVEHGVGGRDCAPGLRMHDVARCRRRIEWPGGRKDGERRRRRAHARHVAVRTVG
jgi:hypothetical protein